MTLFTTIMPPAGLGNFTKIGPRISIYTPEKPANGQLVVLCTWLGAGLRAITKYVALYQAIAPGARILLLESDVSILISSYSRQRGQIRPAVSAVSDTLAECGQNSGLDAPNIVLHTFSNGGTNTATQLLVVLEQQLEKPLPLAGLICDSGPAKGSYWKSYNAMLLSLPRGMLYQTLGAVACHCILLMLNAWIVYGNEDPAELQRRTLLGSSYVRGTVTDSPEGASTMEEHCRVCYLYSTTDLMCQSTDVAEHADEARRKGWLVKEVVFDDSAHCAHLQKHDIEYTVAVRSIWNHTDPAS